MYRELKKNLTRYEYMLSSDLPCFYLLKTNAYVADKILSVGLTKLL